MELNALPAVKISEKYYGIGVANGCSFGDSYKKCAYASVLVHASLYRHVVNQLADYQEATADCFLYTCLFGYVFSKSDCDLGRLVTHGP